MVLPAHGFAHQRGGPQARQPETTSDGVTEVFDPDFKYIYDVPAKSVVHLPPARLNITRLVLCRNYRPYESQSCAMGGNCKFVHADCDYSKLEAHPIHVNYIWRHESLCTYLRLPPGDTLTVWAPNNKQPTTLVPSERVLVTKGSQAYMICLQSVRSGLASPSELEAAAPLSHCAHYYFNRMCNRGERCNFIHAVHVDPTVQGDFKRAPGRGHGHHHTTPVASASQKTEEESDGRGGGGRGGGITHGRRGGANSRGSGAAAAAGREGGAAVSTTSPAPSKGLSASPAAVNASAPVATHAIADDNTENTPNVSRHGQADERRDPAGPSPPARAGSAGALGSSLRQQYQQQQQQQQLQDNAVNDARPTATGPPLPAPDVHDGMASSALRNPTLPLHDAAQQQQQQVVVSNAHSTTSAGVSPSAYGPPAQPYNTATPSLSQPQRRVAGVSSATPSYSALSHDADPLSASTGGGRSGMASAGGSGGRGASSVSHTGLFSPPQPTWLAASEADRTAYGPPPPPPPLPPAFPLPPPPQQYYPPQQHQQQQFYSHPYPMPQFAPSCSSSPQPSASARATATQLPPSPTMRSHEHGSSRSNSGVLNWSPANFDSSASHSATAFTNQHGVNVIPRTRRARHDQPSTTIPNTAAAATAMAAAASHYSRHDTVHRDGGSASATAAVTTTVGSLFDNSTSTLSVQSPTTVAPSGHSSSAFLSPPQAPPPQPAESPCSVSLAAARGAAHTSGNIATVVPLDDDSPVTLYPLQRRQSARGASSHSSVGRGTSRSCAASALASPVASTRSTLLSGRGIGSPVDAFPSGLPWAAGAGSGVGSWVTTPPAPVPPAAMSADDGASDGVSRAALVASPQHLQPSQRAHGRDASRQSTAAAAGETGVGVDSAQPLPSTRLERVGRMGSSVDSATAAMEASLSSSTSRVSRFRHDPYVRGSAHQQQQQQGGA